MTEEELRTKLAVLRDNLERLEQIPQKSLEEFVADFRNLDSVLHRLQTSIQALIDVASFKLTRLGLAAPASSHAILERLETAGHLPAGAAARFAPVFGFRNRIVPLYDRIDPAIVYRLLTEERGDLAELCDLLLDIEA